MGATFRRLACVIGSIALCIASGSAAQEAGSPIVEARAWRGLDAMTATLTNGIEIVHIATPPVDENERAVWVSVFLAGGEMIESRANRGITLAAASVMNETSAIEALDALRLSRPSEFDAGLERIAARLRADQLRIGASSITGGLLVRARTVESDLGPTLRLLKLMLEDPVAPRASLEEWASRATQRVREADAVSVAWDTLRGAIAPVGDVATTTPTREAIAAFDGSAEAGGRAVVMWIARAAREAPMTVAVTGPVARERALRVAAEVFAPCADRSSALGVVLDAHRRAAPREGRIGVTRTLVGADRDVVIVGFRGADSGDASRMRALAVAASVIEHRVRAGSIEGAIGAARVISRPSLAVRGRGVFAIEVTTKPGSADAARRYWLGFLRGLLEQGLASDEVGETAAAQAESAAGLMTDAGYWSWVAPGAAFRGFDVDALGGADRAYASLTAAQVNDALRAFGGLDERWFEVTVRAVPNAGR